MIACTKSNNRLVCAAVCSSRYFMMAGGFPFSSVPWYTTNEAKFVSNLGLGPSARASTPNCSLRCNCKAGFEALTDRSMCTASRYWESVDLSGVEVRKCCDLSSSSAALYQLSGDLGKCSNNCATGTLLGSAFKASNSTGPYIRCEEQRPVLDVNITAPSNQNPPNSAVHILTDGRTHPKYGSEYKTRNPSQKVYLEFEPRSIDDAYYAKMLSSSSENLEAGFLSAKNAEPKVEIYSNDLAPFSDSIDESHMQEGYAKGCSKHDINKIQENVNVSKRKAEQMERKAVATDVQSGKNVDEDSRIVRISRLTGGKDRHSKVLTAKGIRDRRVRLSVLTAIEFYDLQDRLGFEQPSKVVDWLIHNARSAIDELPVLDAEMAASATASAGNLTHLFSSNSSHLEHCVATSRKSTTAAAASAFKFGPGSLQGEGMSSHKAISENAIPIMTLKDSNIGRNSGNSSDGSIKGSVEHYTTNFSMSKPPSRVDARLKARERARKNSASAKNSARSSSAIRQLKPMQPSLNSHFEDVLPFTRVPIEIQCIKDDNPCGIHTQVVSGLDSVQPLWDYNMSSYTGILFTTQDSHPLQNMATSGSSAIKKKNLPVPSTSDSIQAIIGSSLKNFEMADSAFPLSGPKQSRHLGGNAAQGQANLFYSNIPMPIMETVEQQQQQQSETHISKTFASTIIPTFSNDINFSTSSLSNQGPLQSNSSASITNMPYLPDSEECLW